MAQLQKIELATVGPLRLVGKFCQWRLEVPGLLLSPIGKEEPTSSSQGGGARSSKAARRYEYALCFSMSAKRIEFQIVSDTLGFEWRVFPLKGHEGLVRNLKAIDAAVGGRDDGHGQNFLITEDSATIVTIYVTLLSEADTRATIRYDLKTAAGKAPRVGIGGEKVTYLSGDSTPSGTPPASKPGVVTPASLLNEEARQERLRKRNGADPWRAQPPTRPVGPFGEYVVVYRKVVERKRPSVRSEMLEVYDEGALVRGTPWEVEGLPWLQLHGAGWVLRDGASLGLGQLLAPHGEAVRLEFPGPDRFTFGVSMSAYQVEGSWRREGRGPSIWDDFSHSEGSTANGDTGDVACDHYRRYPEDIALMAKMGVQAYRLSLSWSRILPDGRGRVNERALDFYERLVDVLVERGITPWVTLYHWDLPSALEREYNGWLDQKGAIVRDFGAYARLVFERLGDRVKHWVTINEPWCAAVLGYCTGVHAPGRSALPQREPYLAAHNMLRCHAEAARIYRKLPARTGGGQLGLALNTEWREPCEVSSQSDAVASQRAMDYQLGWFADPIWFGDYPMSMRLTLGDRLPKFTPDEVALLHGSCDFFGLNYYTAQMVAGPKRAARAAEDGGSQAHSETNFWSGTPGPGGYFDDLNVKTFSDPDWLRTEMSWGVVPWGLRKTLEYVHARYQPSRGIVVTENGAALEEEEPADGARRAAALAALAADSAAGGDDGAAVMPPPSEPGHQDAERVRYLRAHLAAVHDACAAGADVRGYFVWSLLDNFEWSEGFRRRFGLVHVDFGTQLRTPKASAAWYAGVILRRSLVAPGPAEFYPGVVRH